jgi:hypothetical protein
MSEPSKQEMVVSVRTMEIVTALLFLIFGFVVMTGSLKLGASWGSDGPQSGYFPFYISLIILLSSTVTLYQAIFQSKQQKDEAFVEKEPFRQVMAVFLPALVFVLGVQLIGIYVSAAIYIAVFMVWLGKYAYWKAIAVGVGVSVALYVLFEIWFQVPLPHGSWFNPLALFGMQ